MYAVVMFLVLFVFFHVFLVVFVVFLRGNGGKESAGASLKRMPYMEQTGTGSRLPVMGETSVKKSEARRRRANPGQCNQPTPAPTEMRERRTERCHQYPCCGSFSLQNGSRDV